MKAPRCIISHYIIKHMKRLIGLLLIALPLCFTACSKSPADNEAPVYPQESEYYVKYVSDGLGGNGIYQYNVSYTDETGKNQSFSNMTSDSFERTVGPVSVGFQASFRIWVDNSNDKRTRAARIEVKKDDDPFTVKAEKTGTGQNGVSVTYTIE